MNKAGEWLRDHRKRLNLLQEDVGKRAGVSTSYISTLERGQPYSVTGAQLRPDRDKVIAIAKAVQGDENELLSLYGYAPINAPGPTITLEDIGQISFQKDLAKPERERIERLIRTVLAADKMQRQDEE